jgi:hypothetical protein
MKRPFSVTLLSFLVLIIALVHLLRFVYTISWWRFLTTLQGNPPLLTLFSGFIGTLLGLALFWGLWIGHPRSRLAAKILIPLYLGWEWVEQLLSVQIGNQFENWLFMATSSLVMIIFTYWTLSTSSANKYFGELHESSKED